MAFEKWTVTLQVGFFFVLFTDTLTEVAAGSQDFIRLYGGPSNKEGAVQVNVLGEWKTICNDGWDVLDALVACRELGYTDGYALLWREGTPRWRYHGYLTTTTPTTTPQHFFVEGSNFACNGSEETLLSCKHTKNIHSCSILAGVSCGVTAKYYRNLEQSMWSYSQGSYNLRFIVPVFTGNSAGRVYSAIMNYRNSEKDRAIITGGICNMDKQAAMLICYDQGYTIGGEAIQLPTVPQVPMLIHTLTCHETSSLRSCSVEYTGEGVCPDGALYSGVKCYTTTRPSVIGSLAFAGVASLLILIAGVCRIFWIRRNRKPSSVPLDESHVHS